MIALWDALVRVILGALLIWLGVEKGGVFKITEVVGVVLILTSIISFCPLYKLAGISSRCEECKTG